MSLLVGQSFGPKYGYKPIVYRDLANQLVHDVENGAMKISPAIEHLANAYEKLGFIMYARGEVGNLDTRTNYYDIIIKYHLYNVIFYCKAFLDAVSNTISSALNIKMRKPANIDLSKKKFIEEIACKMPELEEELRNFCVWIDYVTEFRMKLIHRQRIFFLHKELPIHRSQPEMFREPIDPILFFDKVMLDALDKKLAEKYGSSKIYVGDFCQQQLEKAKALFETVILAFKRKIEKEGADWLPWKTVTPEHIGKPVFTKRA